MSQSSSEIIQHPNSPTSQGTKVTLPPNLTPAILKELHMGGAQVPTGWSELSAGWSEKLRLSTLNFVALKPCLGFELRV